MKTKHTPGPWEMSKAKWCQGYWGARDGESGAVGGDLPMIVSFLCHGNDDHDLDIHSRREDQVERKIPDDERWGNAMLVAAAPDLLEALESALETMKENEWYTPLSVIVQAEKAIKKAKGEK